MSALTGANAVALRVSVLRLTILWLFISGHHIHLPKKGNTFWQHCRNCSVGISSSPSSSSTSWNLDEREEKKVSCLLPDSALSAFTLSPILLGRERGGVSWGEEVGVKKKSEVVCGLPESAWDTLEPASAVISVPPAPSPSCTTTFFSKFTWFPELCCNKWDGRGFPTLRAAFSVVGVVFFCLVVSCVVCGNADTG